MSSLQEDIINIQLLYNPNRPTKSDLWDGNFHTISLHGLSEHLFFDIKYIKEFLIYIAKYINNKSVDVNKSNNIADLRNINNTAWKFITSIYNSGWDLLFTNENNNSFRQKVVSKFTSKTNPVKTGKMKKKSTDKPANIKRLFSLISAKSLKKIKKISKYFKITKWALNKLYAQVFKLTTTIREVLKIKEIFPNLQVKKIKNIQKIINNHGKLKPKINMTTKSPLRKQVIILMNNNNKTKFMKDSYNYIANNNRVLKNIKSEVIVDFIYSD